MKKILLLTIGMIGLSASAQNVMTPELLWQLGRVSPLGITKDGKSIIYKVSIPSVEENKSDSKVYSIPASGGKATEITDYEALLKDKNISPDGKLLLSSKEIKVGKVLGKDYYPNLDKSNVQVYDGLDYRHWDTWNDGTHNHVVYSNATDKENFIDIMKENQYFRLKLANHFQIWKLFQVLNSSFQKQFLEQVFLSFRLRQ